MAMNNKGRSKNSICDKSMKMVVNIMKLSPFSGALPPPSTKQVSTFASSVKVATSPPIPHFHQNQRAREMTKTSASCVVVPIEETGSGNGNLRVLCEERVDMDALDFITRMHNRNLSVLNEA